MTTINQAVASVPAATVGGAHLGTAALRAVGTAVAVNATLFLAGSHFALFPQDVLIRGAEAPVTLARVVAVTTLGVAAGAGVFALLRRVAARPLRVFAGVALLALLLSFTQPGLALQGAPLRMVLALNFLHVVAAVALLGELLRIATPGGDGGRR